MWSLMQVPVGSSRPPSGARDWPSLWSCTQRIVSERFRRLALPLPCFPSVTGVVRALRVWVPASAHVSNAFDLTISLNIPKK